LRRKANRLKVKRLFVLGAGASYSASLRIPITPKTAPLDIGLCQRISELNPAKPHWVARSRDLVIESWKDEGAFEQMGLEQAVIRQLGHLEFIRAIHPRRGKGSVEVFEWLSHLTHLMCYALRHTKENSKSIYRKFATKLDLEPENIASADRIVTFNYDDLLDRHIVAKYGPTKTYFDRIKESPDAAERRDGQHPFPMVVKLHGSVNWRCKEEDFEKIINGTSDGSGPIWLSPVWVSSVGSPTPQDAVYPLMVPPLPVKPITSISLFQYLWTVAYEYLHEADEIIVCGYSLPDADRLAWSLFGNFSNRTLKRVTVIDPNPAVMSKWRTLFKRRKVGVARWEYFDDFTAYVEQM